MKKIVQHPFLFDLEMFWDNPLRNVSILNDLNGLDLFVQNGYHLPPKKFKQVVWES